MIGKRGKRRFRIHRRNQPIETERLSLSLKETSFEDAIKRAVPLHQLSGAFWPDPGRARQFVGRITAQRDKVRHLFGIDAISLPDLFRPDAREFATPRRVQDTRAWRGELKGISIATGHQRGTACALLSGDCGGEKVVGFEPWSLGVRKPKGGDKLGQDIELLDQFLIELAPALIGGMLFMATSTARGRSSR